MLQFSIQPSQLVTGLDTQALNLIIPLLTCGASSLTPALLPPPQHLALAATLIVHPTLTTRARSTSHLQVSTLSLRYLRLVLRLAGPINARLQDAFTFSGIGTSARSARRRTTDDLTSSYEDTDITSELATTGALWTQVEDFWKVVGWAFNCSVAHPHRWEYWGLWLEYMLQVLEKDWEMRWFQSDEDGEIVLQNSMIVRYLAADTLSTGHERKVLRAIFADGTKNSLAVFREIWQDETRLRKKDQGGGRTTDKKIDIEADDYGDYMASSSDDDLEDSDPATPIAPFSPLLEEIPNGAATLGGMQALTLRLRLFSLLATVSAVIPSSFLPLYDLYDHSLHFIRPLPLPTFFVLLSQMALTSLTAAAAQSLVQRVLRSLISSSAPCPTHDNLDQEMLEKCYLPFAANTQSVADNAKVSACVEALVALYQRHCGLVWSEELQEAVEKGVEARERKAKKEGRTKGRGKGGGGGETSWLNGSAERIRGYVASVLR